ncbi:hypothetical protein CEXT_786931 [Caerostris extrusa]|uniref:Uncharacterized protein n=1 Tax=Caerostris extrusa TaxID=172846 RepID=A0AAV4Y8I4_CAEEX|nr:hypothetical protein CEXT_786931 [Caerostris extrusa]
MPVSPDMIHDEGRRPSLVAAQKRDKSTEKSVSPGPVLTIPILHVEEVHIQNSSPSNPEITPSDEINICLDKFQKMGIHQHNIVSIIPLTIQQRKTWSNPKSFGQR